MESHDSIYTIKESIHGFEYNEQIFGESLTHLSLAFHKRDIGKQCRPWSDAAERGVWSGLHCLLKKQEIL